MNDKGYTKHQEDIEKTNFQKCIENARKYRISMRRALLCDMSRPLCPKCIFDEDGDK